MGSGRKPGADPDEATYVADQGHAGAVCQAAAFEGNLWSANTERSQRAYWALLFVEFLNGAAVDDSGAADTKTKRKAS